MKYIIKFIIVIASINIIFLFFYKEIFHSENILKSENLNKSLFCEVILYIESIDDLKTFRKYKNKFNKENYSLDNFLFSIGSLRAITRVLITIFLLFGYNVKNNYILMFSKVLLILIIIISILQLIFLVISIQNFSKFKYIKRILKVLANLYSWAFKLYIIIAIYNNNDYLLSLIFMPLTINIKEAKITFENEYVKIEDLGNSYRITIRGIVWAEIKKEQDFEFRVMCVQLRKARKENGEPLMELKEIVKAFNLKCISTISHWDINVQKKGLLYLDFKKHSKIIAKEFVQNTQVLTEEVLERIQKLCQENPFITYPEVKQVLFDEGIKIQIADTSIRSALERISFYHVRDVLIKQLKAGKLSYRENYLIDLIKELIQKIEKGEKFPKAKLISFYHVTESANEIHTSKSNRKNKIKAEDIAQELFSNFQNNKFRDELVEAELVENYNNSELVEAELVENYNNSELVEAENIISQQCNKISSSIGQIMLILRLYVVERSTYRNVAKLLGISVSTCFERIAIFAKIAPMLSAFIGVTNFSGTLCIDDKWIKIAEIKRVSRGKEKFGYAFFAIDPMTLDLVYVEIFDKNGAKSFEAFLLKLISQGIKPKRIITDLASGYGEVIQKLSDDGLLSKRVIHHLCLFHFKQSIFKHLDNAFRRDSKIKENKIRKHLKQKLEKHIFKIVDTSCCKTSRKLFHELEPIKKAYLVLWPNSKPVFECLERHFEKIINARENGNIVLTNNPAESVIRIFNQHYKTMAGFETIESARNYLLIFQLVYRFSELDDEIVDINRRGKAPISLAGYKDVEKMPFYRYLNEPLLADFSPSLN